MDKEQIAKIVVRCAEAFLDELSDDEFVSGEWIDDFFAHIDYAVRHWEELDG